MRVSFQADQSIWSVKTLWEKEKKMNFSVRSHDTKILHSEIRLTLSQTKVF